MSVLTMVVDPDFQKLAPPDQQAALSGMDPAFGQLSQGDFTAAVTGLQKRALSRPDLVSPPATKAGAPSSQSLCLRLMRPGIQCKQPVFLTGLPMAQTLMAR